MPKTFRFILTDQMSNRTYCTCIVFTEEVPESVYMLLTPAYLPSKKYYYEKALCVTSELPLFENMRLFLGEIYRIQVSSTCTTFLEKHISYFVESIIIDYNDIVNALSYELGNSVLKFHGQPCYFRESDYFKEHMFLPTVSTLPLVVLYELFKTILLEGKILITSKSCNLLSNVITNLLSLIYPFRWPHVLIPILPLKMKQFIDAPVPYIIGVNYNIREDDIADDILLISLDLGMIVKSPKDATPDPPKTLTEKMLKRLKKIYSQDFNEELMFFLESFDDVFIQLDMIEDVEKFSSMDFKESFFEFFLALFKNYDKYFKLQSSNQKIVSISPIKFNREALLKDYNSTNPNSFLSKFTETSIFNFFVDDNLGILEGSETIQFIIEKVKNGKGKDKYFFPIFDPTPNRIVDPVEKYNEESPKIMSNNNSQAQQHQQVNTNGLKMKINNLSNHYRSMTGKNESLVNLKIAYKTFPRLDPTRYIKSTKTRDVYYVPKFIFQNDEWCYSLTKLNSKDWSKYICLLVYEVWIQMAILFLQANSDVKLIDEVFAIISFLISDLTKQKKITASKNMFYKLIKCFGYLGSKLNLDLTRKIQDFIKLMPTNSQASAYHVFMQGLTKTSQIPVNKSNSGLIEQQSPTVKEKINGANLRGSSLFRRISEKKIIHLVSNQKQKKDSVQSSDDESAGSTYIILGNSAFICYNYCANCKSNTQKPSPIFYEELLCSYKKEKYISHSVCLNCSSPMTPHLYILHILQKSPKSIESIKLLYINHLIKEIENVLRLKGELNFIPNLSGKYKENKEIFWNMVFYFRYFGLPTFVLDKDAYYESIKLETEETRSILLDKKKRPYSKSFTSGRNLLNASSDYFKKAASQQVESAYVNSQPNITVNSKPTTCFADWEKLLDNEM